MLKTVKNVHYRFEHIMFKDTVTIETQGIPRPI